MSKTATTVYGIHAVNRLLHIAPQRVIELAVMGGRGDERLKTLLDRAVAAGIATSKRSRRDLDTLAGERTHQGVVATVRPARMLDENALESVLTDSSDPLLLILDGVQDPHNLGACLRCADAAGADAVIIPKNRAAGLTGAARKVASGAAETVPVIRVTNLARSLRALKAQGISLLGLDGEAEISLYDQDLTGPLAIIMGGEGQGLRRLTKQHCDTLVALPMRGMVESLNVSVASGVCLYEAIRQRKTCHKSRS